MNRADIPLYWTPETNNQKQVCPWCAGGSSNEASFSISRTEDGYAFHCHRDSCRAVHPSSGFWNVSGRVCIPQEAVKQRGVRPLEYDTRPLHASEAAYLMQRYQLYPETLEQAMVRYAPELQRYIFPVRGPAGELRGHIARSYKPDTQPKVLTYKVADPFVHWTGSTRMVVSMGANMPPVGPPIVVVEDMISGLRVQQDTEYTALVLLGTHLAPLAASELSEIGRYSTVRVALDADATDKAYAMTWELRGLVARPRVVRLEHDLKDERTAKRVREVLG